MAREARIVVPGAPHHVTHRGNNRQNIFCHPCDYQAYAAFLAQACRVHPVALHSYCFMSNHVHLVITPQAEEALALAVGQTDQRYALYFNGRYKRTGHLWESRFYSCPLDEAYFMSAMRYTECNPVRANLAMRAWEYPWSSAAVHTDRDGNTLGLELVPFTEASASDWEQVLCEVQAPTEIEALRRSTQQNRPLGDRAFVKHVETILGRSLQPRPRGRPRK